MDAGKLPNLEREQNELRHMIQEGVTFDVEVSYSRRRPGFWGFLKKHERIKEKRVYRIQEPTLATLDRLSSLWIKMDIDEAKLTDNDYLATAKAMAGKHARTLAEVVAVAVLGEDLYETSERAGAFTFTPDEAKLRRLTETFYHTVKPSELFTLAILITNVSNLGDFTSSMRLMSATRTSEPMSNRIEQQA